jgi:hypothetical protein
MGTMLLGGVLPSGPSLFASRDALQTCAVLDRAGSRSACDRAELARSRLCGREPGVSS